MFHTFNLGMDASDLPPRINSTTILKKVAEPAWANMVPTRWRGSVWVAAKSRQWGSIRRSCEVRRGFLSGHVANETPSSQHRVCGQVVHLPKQESSGCHPQRAAGHPIKAYRGKGTLVKQPRDLVREHSTSRSRNQAPVHHHHASPSPCRIKVSNTSSCRSRSPAHTCTGRSP